MGLHPEVITLKKNKIKSLLLVLFLIAGLMSGLVHPSVSVTRAEAKRKLPVTVKIDSKKVNKKTVTMKKGSSKKIKLSFIPNQSGVKTKYRSDKKGIVSVSRKGTLKAKKTGTAKITLKVTGKGNQKKKIWFKVKVVGENSSNKKTEISVNEIPVIITVAGKKFAAKFYDNKTARALVQKMPMTLSMKELNGNEKYYYFDTDLPTKEVSPKQIQAGDIKLYGSDCLVAFYKTFTTSYSYTSVGYIEDVAGFVNAVGKGNVKITFQKG